MEPCKVIEMNEVVNSQEPIKYRIMVESKGEGEDENVTGKSMMGKIEIMLRDMIEITRDASDGEIYKLLGYGMLGVLMCQLVGK